jgi:hypothetical protein
MTEWRMNEPARTVPGAHGDENGGEADMWDAVVLADRVHGSGDFGGVHLVPASEPAAVADLVERLGCRHLVVAAPSGLGDAAALGAALAAGRFPGCAVTRLDSPHAPIALLCVLAQARTVRPEPGLGLQLARRALDRSWSGAWTRRVTGLSAPAPSFGQHLRSYLPGSSFVVRHWPDPAVLRRSADGGPGALPTGRVLVTEDGLPDDLGAHLLAAATATITRIDLGGSWESVYGRAPSVQIALVPENVGDTAQAPAHACVNCGGVLVEPECPFCRLRARPFLAGAAATVRGSAAGLPGPVPEAVGS